MKRSLLAGLILVVGAAPAPAQPQPPEPIKLTLPPIAEPVPALKYPLLPELSEAFRRVAPRTPRLPVVRCRTDGPVATRAEDFAGDDWVRHAREVVDLAAGLRTLARLDCRVILEAGPRPVLKAAE